ncbi:MAG: hypothetical protein FJY82_02605, partial [Candidatus Aminicenantes bacterium]|nr:hypothetical protein [Candidatus Aminicenantes bacterium]
WRHTGFNVHSRVRAKTKPEAERVGKYMIRPVLSLERRGCSRASAGKGRGWCSGQGGGRLRRQIETRRPPPVSSERSIRSGPGNRRHLDACTASGNKIGCSAAGARGLLRWDFLTPCEPSSSGPNRRRSGRRTRNICQGLRRPSSSRSPRYRWAGRGARRS